MDRGGLVTQMAKAFVGESIMDPTIPDEDARRHADEALCRVELFLGVSIEEAQDLITKVLEDVT